MFDIGFWEILLIVILALLVIGPERLPGAAKKAGYWMGRGRRFVEGVRSDVESQVDLGEFKRLLHNQEVQINELQEKLKTGVSDVEGGFSNLENQILTDVPSHKFESDDAASQYEIIEDTQSADSDDSRAAAASVRESKVSESLASEVISSDSNDAELKDTPRSGTPS